MHHRSQLCIRFPWNMGLVTLQEVKTIRALVQGFTQHRLRTITQPLNKSVCSSCYMGRGPMMVERGEGGKGPPPHTLYRYCAVAKKGGRELRMVGVLVHGHYYWQGLGYIKLDNLMIVVPCCLKILLRGLDVCSWDFRMFHAGGLARSHEAFPVPGSDGCIMWNCPSCN